MSNGALSTCSVPDCERPVKARGRCLMHYKRARKAGELALLRDSDDAPAPRQARSSAPCAVDGCGRVIAARGWCNGHYSRWRTKGDVDAATPLEPRRSTNAICTARSCRRDARRRGLCGMHYQRRLRLGDENAATVRPDRWTTKGGYVMLARPDHPNANSSGRIFEHRAVMVEMLGRPLLPGENVHHKNGVRDDNAPSNLELWVSSQPSGQRVEDVVAHAREMLARYAGLVAG